LDVETKTTSRGNPAENSRVFQDELEGFGTDHPPDVGRGKPQPRSHGPEGISEGEGEPVIEHRQEEDQGDEDAVRDKRLCLLA